MTGKKGKVIINKDGISYEIKEKVFFRTEVEGLYYVSGDFLEKSTYTTINLNRLVESIEFIDCNFEYLSNRGKTSLTLVAYCPVKIINSTITNNMNVIIDDELFDVEVTNYKSKAENTLKISSNKVKLTDIQDTSIDIKAKNTSISDCNVNGGQCNILTMYLSLKDLEIIQSNEVNITSAMPIEWENVKLSSNELYINGLINSHKMTKEEFLYKIDDSNIEELLVKNKLYSVLQGLQTIVNSKKREVRLAKKAELDIKINETLRHLQELEQNKKTTLDKIDGEMSKQKVYSYTKKDHNI